MECIHCGVTISYYIGEPEICPECGNMMFEACPICHGEGVVMDSDDPCTECDGSGKVGGERDEET